MIIPSTKYTNVFYRSEKARFWADNTVDRNKTTCSEHVASLAARDNKNYLILHPEDHDKDVPPEYEGMVIRYGNETGISFDINFAN